MAIPGLTRNQNQYLHRRACGLCEVTLDRDMCCSIFGPACTPEFLAARRERVLLNYKPRAAQPSSWSQQS